MLILSVTQIVLIVTLIVIKLINIFAFLYQPLFIALALSSTVLLFLAQPIFKQLFLQLKSQSHISYLASHSQFFLHYVVMVFIIFDQFYQASYSIMLGFSPFLILFFLTAIITWRACYSALRSKVYKFFITGSTALLVWSIVLTLLGLFYQNSFLSQNLHTLLLCYFALHFAELGFVLLKISSDLESVQISTN